MAKKMKHLEYYERELIAEFRAAGRSMQIRFGMKFYAIPASI